MAKKSRITTTATAIIFFIHVLLSHPCFSFYLNSNNHFRRNELIKISTTFLSSQATLPDSEQRLALGEAFYQRLIDLHSYKKEHGDCLVPKRYEPNPTLGNWVNKQRQQYKLLRQGKKTSLTKDRVRALDDMGFVWDAARGSSRQTRIHKDLWKKRYEELRKYKEANGHCSVSTRENAGLAYWVINQRKRYVKGKMNLDQMECEENEWEMERIKALDELGFGWKSTREALWEERINDLRKFKEEKGHCKVPISYDENKKLANWVSTQRKNYNLRMMGGETSLTEERVKQLEDLGFAWSVWDFEDPLHPGKGD